MAVTVHKSITIYTSSHSLLNVMQLLCMSHAAQLDYQGTGDSYF